MVGISLGTVALVLVVYGLCVPILSVTGRYDVITQFAAYWQGEGSDLYQLKQDTIKACQANAVVEDEAKDFKNKANSDDEPKDYTEKTMAVTGDQSARRVDDEDNGETNSNDDQEENNIKEVSDVSETFNV